MSTKKYTPLYAVIFLFFSMLLLGVLIPVTKAHAFTPKYSPNNLIDNPTLLDDGTMSAPAIQSFLTNVGSGLAGYSDVEACNSTIAPYYTHCSQTISAAQIIYDAAKAYGINPRVILATLEKEQSLVTDPSPSASQINCAMGYNSCGGYVGFFTQVDNGTWIIRYNYEGASSNATWLSWHPSANYPCSTAKSGFYSAGLYPPNVVTFADSGGTPETVTLTNAATASLYCYTPYVGPYSLTGYSGSYNFVYYYQLWFGSTQVSVPYAWSYVGQGEYADSARTVPFTNGIVSIQPGNKAYIEVKARNNGYQTWNQPIVRLGTSDPEDRSSVFADSSWLSSNRIQMVETSVTPGGVGTFDFSITAPSTTGSYSEYFNPLAEGIGWFNDPGLYFRIDVVTKLPNADSANNKLVAGQSLLAGQNILSADTQSTLAMQQDGNLVLYGDFLPLWASLTGGAGNKLIMQSDGNLVLYSSTGTALWNSRTNGNPGAYVTVQVDGDMVIYSNTGTALWSSGTVNVPDHLSKVDENLTNSFLLPGQSLITADRKHQMVLQFDGNLVIYSSGRPTWSSGTTGKSSARLAMQADGNLVIYDSSGRAVWNSNTPGRGISQLHMQSDGNLVIYNGAGQPTWETRTDGL